MPEPLKLSIVTPSFNSKHTIRETLESVAHQDYPQVEHIVVDGGSSDGTIEILKDNPKLRWISEKDEGHYHAMNKGIQMAGGEAVGILNADDCYCPGILTKVGAAFRAHPEWDALFGDFIFVDGSGKEIFRREEACWDAQIVRFGFGMAMHQALFVKKATYDRLGLLRHKDFKNSCDYEFLMRMTKAKCRVGHIPEYIVRYRYHQHGQSADKRIVANMARESALIRKEYGVPGGWVGKLLGYYARAKRQAEKLLLLGKCDLTPGAWRLRRQMREKTEFSSNIGLDKL
ncbi:MAG TPA: glycosyltransferase family 2 protein [Candidatus Binatia bacterium]|jgi:glycosyltransferase involved in cell wall biosynthesis|nr:glycosyltransferase family 2 protein [Candidatus Binatia bacterium]